MTNKYTHIKVQKIRIYYSHPTEYRTEIYKKNIFKTSLRLQYRLVWPKISKKAVFLSSFPSKYGTLNFVKKTEKKWFYKFWSIPKKQLFLALPDLFTPPKRGMKRFLAKKTAFWISVNKKKQKKLTKFWKFLCQIWRW